MRDLARKRLDELPSRADPWNGWRLLSLDLSRTDALVLTSPTDGPDRLPVVRAPQSPAIVTQTANQ